MIEADASYETATYANPLRSSSRPDASKSSACVVPTFYPASGLDGETAFRSSASRSARDVDATRPPHAPRGITSFLILSITFPRDNNIETRLSFVILLDRTVTIYRIIRRCAAVGIDNSINRLINSSRHYASRRDLSTMRIDADSSLGDRRILINRTTIRSETRHTR